MTEPAAPWASTRVTKLIQALEQGGKTSAGIDTFQGRFVELVPNAKIVELIEFESADARFGGEMKMTTSLVDTDAGTEVTVLHGSELEDPVSL